MHGSNIASAINAAHARGDITREERDHMIAGAYRHLTDDERRLAGERLARLILRNQKGTDGRTLPEALSQYIGDSPAMALADAALFQK